MLQETLFSSVICLRFGSLVYVSQVCAGDAWLGGKSVIYGELAGKRKKNVRFVLFRVVEVVVVVHRRFPRTGANFVLRSHVRA